jgi:hypothetical protein
LDLAMTLVIALMSLVLLSALGTSLAVVMTTELRASANYATSREGMYAADGALQIAAHELLAVTDWNVLLSGGALSAFVDGPAGGSRPLGDGSSVDLTQATALANGEPRPWGANNPTWQLFAFGWLGPRTYVIVWAADDPAENDGDPSVDGDGVTNPGAGILALRAEAFGVGGAHKVLEATIRRDVDAVVGPAIRVLSWQEIR